MKFLSIIFVGMLIACGASGGPGKISHSEIPITQKPNQVQLIPEIDALITKLKHSYVKTCYLKVVNHNPPETDCQFELYDILERRYGLDFTKHDVDRSANQIFFPIVERKIITLIQTNYQVGQKAKQVFPQKTKLLKHYKEAYSFVSK